MSLPANLKASATMSIMTTGPRLHTDEQRIAARAMREIDNGRIPECVHLLDALRIVANGASPMSDHELSYYASVR